MVNVPVAENISRKLNKKVVSNFLKENLTGNPLYAITSDGKTMYRPIIEKYKAFHQLCVFHLLKNLRKEVSWYLKRTSTKKRDRFLCAVYVSLIYEVFRFLTVEDAEKKFEEVLDYIDVAPSRIREYIKKLMEDFDLYTAYLSDPYIAKTNNQLEEYYCQTEPKKVKKQYKTPEGLLHVLNQKAIFCIIRHGWVSTEASLRCARRHFGKRYDKPTILKIFLKKKKHVLTYWMGD